MSTTLLTTRKLTKAEKRAAKIEREAQEFAERDAERQVKILYPREDPLFTGLSEEEIKISQSEEKERIRRMMLTMARYYLGPRGQLEERITNELTKRCGNKDVAKKLVGIIDCQKKDEKTLMEILVKLLQNGEVCRGEDAQQQWGEFVEPYLDAELVASLRLIREKREEIARFKKQAAEEIRRREEEVRLREEEHRLREEETRRREVAEQRAAEDARGREVAEQRAAELTERLARYEAGETLLSSRDVARAGTKRGADIVDEAKSDEIEVEHQGDGKRVKGVGL